MSNTKVLIPKAALSSCIVVWKSLLDEDVSGILEEIPVIRAGSAEEAKEKYLKSTFCAAVGPSCCLFCRNLEKEIVIHVLAKERFLPDTYLEDKIKEVAGRFMDEHSPTHDFSEQPELNLGQNERMQYILERAEVKDFVEDIRPEGLRDLWVKLHWSDVLAIHIDMR